MKILQKLILLFFCISAQNFALTPWTWCFKKKFGAHVLNDGNSVFKKENTPYFSQLLFSWNAFRPEKGFFRFFVRTHFADKQNWSEWHPVADWGAGIQKTRYSKEKSGLVQNYVRFQLPKGRDADGFEVKVEALGGASLSGIKMVACSCANFTCFKSEVGSNRYDDLPSLHIPGVPMRSQMFLPHKSAEYLCSPVSLSLLSEFLLQKPVDSVSFADNVYDQNLDIYGSWPLNTAYAFEVANGAFYCHVQRLHSFKVLYNYLKQNLPVIVSVCGILEGAAKTHFDGHLLLVVGYDAATRSVLCHDSAVGYGLRVSAGNHFKSIPTPKNTLKSYPLHNFLQVCEARHRLAYVVEFA